MFLRSHPGRSRRAAWSIGSGLLALALLAWWLHAPSPDPQATPAAASAGGGSAAFPWAATPAGPVPPDAVPAPVAVAAQAPASGQVAPAMPAVPPPAGPGAAGQRGVFRTDAQGRLLVDAPMRQRVEHLLALHDGEALATRLEAELAGLPAPAAARARALVDQFQAYQAAQRASFPPGQAPLVPEEGLAQLAALQAMRASHFGAEAARQMYAEDDAVTQRLLTLMRDERSTLLSMEQKAMRAQARFDVERGAVRP